MKYELEHFMRDPLELLKSSVCIWLLLDESGQVLIVKRFNALVHVR